MTETLQGGPARERRAVPGTYNLRETGGYPIAGDRRVRAGVLYRSDALHALTESGRAELDELGLRTIVDLRTESEVAERPNAVDGLGIEIRHVPLFADAAPAIRIGEAGRVDLEQINHQMLRHSGARIVEAVRVIAIGEAPVLVHCTAGKDRTGLVVALVLEAIGVERESVVADYAASERHLAGEWADAMLARMTTGALPEGVDLVGIVTTSPAPLMRRVLEHVDREHGGARGYLRAHGLTDEELDALVTALTEPA